MARQARSRRNRRRIGSPVFLVLATVAALGVFAGVMPTRVTAQDAVPAMAEEATVATPLSGGGAANGFSAPATEQPGTDGERASLPNLVKIHIDLDKAQGYLTDVKDGEFGVIEAGSLWLLKQAGELDRSLFDPDPPDQEVSFANLMEAPMLYRGRPVTVSGRVGTVSRYPVEMDKLPSVKTLWKIEIFKPTRGKLAYVCTLLVSEDPGKLKPHTDVRMKGYFYKLRKFEFDQVTDMGTEVYEQDCPIVVGRYVQVVDKRAKGATPGAGGGLMDTKASVMFLASIVAGILFMVLLLLFVRKFMARRQAYAVRPQRELTEEELAERRRFLEQAESRVSPNDQQNG